jgi:hypothetical protein
MSFAKRGNRLLKEVKAFRVTPEISSGFILEYLETLDCPRSLTVALLFRNKEHEQLANLEVDPLQYRDVQEFRDAYAATKFLSKFKDLVLDYDLDQVAMEKFEKFENLCKLTNARFRALELDPKYRGPVVRLHSAVARKISKVLGEFDSQEFFEMADWGPGATTLLKARDASATNKFQCETGITRDLYSLLPSELLKEVYPLWVSHISEIGFPNFQVGNKIVTVPKDATANRVIAIEPGINLWFQKAIGSMIQKRLFRCGIDLRQQSTNQSLAYLASKDAINATIDFSSASDSISAEVIRELFEHCSYSERHTDNLSKWFSVLDSCRSHYGHRDGVQVKWAKFSSMGNGFTFQLESLLFYAIAKSCMEYVQSLTTNAVEGTVSVYGDDVIIPCSCLEIFSVMCDFYGFTINVKKSHFSSLFRESCGSHFMAGVDVKPLYLKSHLSGVLSVYRLANSIRRFAHRGLASFGCEKRFSGLFDRLVSLVPKPLRVRIPETLGDGGFISNWDEASPVRARHCIEGYFVLNVTEVGRTYQSEGIGLLLDRLWSASSQERRNTVSLRDRTRVRFVRSLVQQWYSLGPWI